MLLQPLLPLSLSSSCPTHDEMIGVPSSLLGKQLNSVQLPTPGQVNVSVLSVQRAWAASCVSPLSHCSCRPLSLFLPLLMRPASRLFFSVLSRSCARGAHAATATTFSSKHEIADVRIFSVIIFASCLSRSKITI